MHIKRSNCGSFDVPMDNTIHTNERMCIDGLLKYATHKAPLKMQILRNDDQEPPPRMHQMQDEQEKKGDDEG